MTQAQQQIVNESGVCWQYNVRIRSYEQDLAAFGLARSEAEALRVPDFTFSQTTTRLDEVVEFIKQYEWLVTMPLYPTHRFIATYKDKLVGAVVMAMPNAFSKILGTHTRKIERVIARGASISWAPKNLASSLIMFSVRWMIQNTDYRLFTAYADPTAYELGTIYQACNFMYLGQTSGAGKMFYHPDRPDKLFSDRSFRSRSAYKRYAKRLEIEWDSSWQLRDKILWENVPHKIATALRDESKIEESAHVMVVPKRKHKYAYLAGRSKGETRALFKDLISNGVDPHRPYPKQRGA